MIYLYFVKNRRKYWRDEALLLATNFISEMRSDSPLSFSYFHFFHAEKS